ncbi:MAG: hypothetical protein DWQ37_23655 [Planctomycetota bacterium]|nr:MAG: hypothetical protein DWQ37_23655 [Planctomycetota bacterium]
MASDFLKLTVFKGAVVIVNLKQISTVIQTRDHLWQVQMVTGSPFHIDETECAKLRKAMDLDA